MDKTELRKYHQALYEAYEYVKRGNNRGLMEVIWTEYCRIDQQISAERGENDTM